MTPNTTTTTSRRAAAPPPTGPAGVVRSNDTVGAAGFGGARPGHLPSHRPRVAVEAT